MSRFGSIGTQYFDNAGDPLVSGKLYFYEAGTDTNKTTYADVNQAIPNTNPVLLTAAGRQPNIFFSGTAKAVLTDGDDVQIEERDPVGGETAEVPFSDWNADTVYDVPDIVVGPDGYFYISITDSNTGSNPTTTPADWTQIRFIRVWNTNETYEPGAIVEGSDGLLYSGITSSNTGNNPTSDLTNWQPAIEATVPDLIQAAARSYAYNNF